MNSKNQKTVENLSEEELFFPSADGNEEAEASPEEQNKLPRRTGDAFRGEVDALLELHPEWRGKLSKGENLPGEVIASCAKNGTPLRAALAEYEVKQAKREIERLRRENAILRQNASAAAKAPVKGAASGSAETKGKDPFLEGLLSED